MSTGTIDKALAYIGNFLKNLVTVKQVTSSTVTITANGSATFSLDMSKEGYTPVGLRQLQNNSGSTTVINGYWWSGNTLNVYMKNTTSSAQSVYCIATVAYVKIVGGVKLIVSSLVRMRRWRHEHRIDRQGSGVAWQQGKRIGRFLYCRMERKQFCAQYGFDKKSDSITCRNIYRNRKSANNERGLSLPFKDNADELHHWLGYPISYYFKRKRLYGYRAIDRFGLSASGFRPIGIRYIFGSYKGIHEGNPYRIALPERGCAA